MQNLWKIELKNQTSLLENRKSRDRAR